MAASMTCIKSSFHNGASMPLDMEHLHFNDIDIEKCTIALIRFTVCNSGALHYFASIRRLLLSNN